MTSGGTRGAGTDLDGGGRRDRRLDASRGIAVLLIFLDHIPQNVAALITPRNLGFSDATELFLFLSGVTAALAFERRRAARGYPVAAVAHLGRIWSLYVAHILLFVLFTAQVALTAARFANPMYGEEMMVTRFLDEPGMALIQALLLRFQPRFLDILPVYILLLLITPLALAVPWRRFGWVLAGGGILYLAVQRLGWQPEAYPDGRDWTFNPFAWQFLFVIGLAAGRAMARGRSLLPAWPDLTPLATIYLLFAAVVALSRVAATQRPEVPILLEGVGWLADRSDLGPGRLLHMLCLAIVAVRLVPKDHKLFAAAWIRPLLLIGRHSFSLFILGIFLSFSGHLLLVGFDGGMAALIGVDLVGCVAMLTVAGLIEWYQGLARPRRAGTPGARRDGGRSA